MPKQPRRTHMFTRLVSLALLLVSLALGGCVSIKETTTRNNDGTTTTERSVNGWAASPYVAPRVYAPVPIYGRDYYYGGYSHNPRPPVPYVTYGRMLSGSIREAFVDGTRRICDIRPATPNHCNRVDEANGWPRR